ncbi:MAG: galactokinase [Chloroflexi bacterium]|nr:galactokinase [Chloroflexota bacterium]
MNIDERKTLISKQFQQAFGALPELWVRAPGRVDLMGSHTDYNMGYVMTMTVNQDTWIAARHRPDRQVCLRSLNIDGQSCIDLDNISHDKDVPWSNYVRGVAKVLQEKGYALQGFDGLIHSTIPFGSGLSSSAALEMASAIVFQQVGGFRLDPVQMALHGQEAENKFVGVSTGILDQYSSAMGKEGCALKLDCRYLVSENVQISSELQVVICDTRAERNLVGSEYDDRRKQCERGVRFLQQFYPEISALRDVSLDQFSAHAGEMPELVARRCRFIIEENQRVLDLAEAFPRNDLATIEKLFSASYAGARDLFEIGAPSMEAMISAILNSPGIVSGRQAGAGFGGCMVSLVKADQVEAFSQQVHKLYQEKTGIAPRIFSTSASAGAGLLNFG